MVIYGNLQSHYSGITSFNAIFLLLLQPTTRGGMRIQMMSDESDQLNQHRTWIVPRTNIVLYLMNIRTPYCNHIESKSFVLYSRSVC